MLQHPAALRNTCLLRTTQVKDTDQGSHSLPQQRVRHICQATSYGCMYCFMAAIIRDVKALTTAFMLGRIFHNALTCRAAHQGEAYSANYSIDHQGILLEAGVGLAALLRLLLLIAAGQQVAHLQRQSFRAET